jgi:hypothetical protein
MQLMPVVSIFPVVSRESTCRYRAGTFPACKGFQNLKKYLQMPLFFWW